MTPNGQVPDGDPFAGAGVNLGSGSGGSQAASGDDPFSGSGTNLGSRRV